ncbi:MAG: carbon storage regulator CsrA [Gammaproteobacteria bacterium]|nr:carbon storage regulator CsrA [Gammaproteobacteria bacterium]
MLSLTRRIGESIMLGDDIEIVVSAVRGSQVKLAIAAPDDLKIYRKEIYEKIQEEKNGHNK